jgi:hypothetical protein
MLRKWDTGISSYFSGDQLFFTAPERLVRPEVLIILGKPKDGTPLRTEHLSVEDKRWLTIGPHPLDVLLPSSLDWNINPLEFKARFQMETLPWLPELDGKETINGKAEDLGDHLTIRLTPASFGR